MTSSFRTEDREKRLLADCKPLSSAGPPLLPAGLSRGALLSDTGPFAFGCDVLHHFQERRRPHPAAVRVQPGEKFPVLLARHVDIMPASHAVEREPRESTGSNGLFAPRDHLRGGIVLERPARPPVRVERARVRQRPIAGLVRAG